ncbi:MAG: hypothetical protein GX214_09745 [Clostridiales bacterium]|nr:hypothetical protein [Clostridiales bacterium]
MNNMNKRKINQVHETNLVDENGEIKSQRTDTSFYVDAEPPYVKMYLDTILYLKDLPRTHNPILHCILMRIPWANQNQDIAINAHIKRQIAKEVNCSESKVNNAISDLVKGEVIYRVGVGTYQVNPHFFGRGQWTDIEELRLNITFNGKGKTIMGEIERKSKKKSENENSLSPTGTEG